MKRVVAVSAVATPALARVDEGDHPAEEPQRKRNGAAIHRPAARSPRRGARTGAEFDRPARQNHRRIARSSPGLHAPVAEALCHREQRRTHGAESRSSTGAPRSGRNRRDSVGGAGRGGLAASATGREANLIQLEVSSSSAATATARECPSGGMESSLSSRSERLPVAGSVMSTDRCIAVACVASISMVAIGGRQPWVSAGQTSIPRRPSSVRRIGRHRVQPTQG